MLALEKFVSLQAATQQAYYETAKFHPLSWTLSLLKFNYRRVYMFHGSAVRPLAINIPDTGLYILTISWLFESDSCATRTNKGSAITQWKKNARCERSVWSSVSIRGSWQSTYQVLRNLVQNNRISELLIIRSKNIALGLIPWWV